MIRYPHCLCIYKANRYWMTALKWQQLASSLKAFNEPKDQILKPKDENFYVSSILLGQKNN